MYGVAFDLIESIPLLLNIGGLMPELFLSFKDLYLSKVTFGVLLKPEFMSLSISLAFLTLTLSSTLSFLTGECLALCFKVISMILDGTCC